MQEDGLDTTPKLIGDRLLTPLRERRFALYLAGQLLSQIGDGIYLVTLPFVMLDQGGGPANLGVVLACYGAARLAFLPVGGALADRRGARPVMLAADALRALVVLGFVVLTAYEHIPLWTMVAVAVPFGALGGISSCRARRGSPGPRWAERSSGRSGAVWGC